ncbi:MAG TPA: M4 family metallopeptidase [Bacteroidales bacterium]|nr:M4 family metallopeptidase [Bacteroidales bacterium]
MKPCLLSVTTVFCLCMTVFPQNPDSVSSVPVNILFPDSGFIVIDGRVDKTGDKAFPVLPGMQFAVPATRSERKQSEKKSGRVFIERANKKTAAGEPATEQFFEFLKDTKVQTGIVSPVEDFKITGVHTDNLGITHVRAIQQYKGIEVYGSESILHIKSSKVQFNSAYQKPAEDITVVPAITEERACDIVIADIRKLTSYSVLSQEWKKLLHYTDPVASLVLYQQPDSRHALAWLITIRPNYREEWKYFVDAAGGNILQKYNNTNYDGPVTATGEDLNGQTRTFNVYLAGDIYFMYDITQPMFNSLANEGIIITLDANQTSPVNLDYTYVTSIDNSWTQKNAISAHCNATKTYTYFDTTFKRNSINDYGCNIVSLVNVAMDDGSEMENAFWNGQAIFYGNGGERFRPLAAALDVTAHELSHGVITSTANLDYFGQSGAIAESFADIFACMVDRNDWKIGEDIVKEGYYPSGAIRDLSDPHNSGDSADYYWQPAHTSEMFLGSEDNGGVHINSGICNYVYYLFASSVGKAKAEKIYYRALTEYLTKTCRFIDLRLAIVQAAEDLYGENSNEVFAAGQAFEKAGIYEETPVKIPGDYKPNPGEQMLLTYDTSPADPVTLYVSKSAGTSYRALSKTPMTGKVSVTDDGSTGVFVSSDRRLRLINTNSTEPNERIISGFSGYDRVAISKDGNRLAATKMLPDGSIYVIDLKSGGIRQFILYNPTTSDANLSSGGVLKAYSVDFDISGQYIIYGAYNIINSNSQKDIYYWDIGIIKVWDNHTNQFGSGAISKLYNMLPAHVNISNPVFSKNSPDLIAFDYYYDDGILEEYSVCTANLSTGTTGIIAGNDRLGYPSFSTNDDRIAYSTINGFNTQVVKSVRLSADKMSADGEPGVLVPDAKWPVFFTIGKRPLGLAPVSDFTVDYKYGKFPLETRFMSLSSNEPDSLQWLFEGGEPDSSTAENPVVYYENPGWYDVTLITSNQYGSDTLVRYQYIHAIDPVKASDYEPGFVAIYPNPVTDQLNVSSSANHYTVSIFDSGGNTVVRVSDNPVIDVSSLVPGLYIMELKSENSITRHKLVKQ